jgi:hypothetical protein
VFCQRLGGFERGLAGRGQWWDRYRGGGLGGLRRQNLAGPERRVIGL